MGRRSVPWGERYRVSKRILGESFRVVASMRGYWMFPVASALLMGGWMLVMMTQVFQGFGEPGAQRVLFGIEDKWLMGLVLVGSLFPVMFFVTLANSALVFGVYQRLDGVPVPVGVAWRRALSRWGTILRFTVFGLVVGTLIGAVGQVLDKIRFIPGLGQVLQIVGALGWAAASFFVFPIIVVEGERRMLGALRRSVGIARAQWGKSVAGIVTISLALLLPWLIVVGVLMLGVLVAPVVLGMGLHPGMAIWILTVLMPSVLVFIVVGSVVLGMLNQALQSTYQAGLYRYATTGEVGGGYSREALVDAWAPYREP